jgi:hypothetical protein
MLTHVLLHFSNQNNLIVNYLKATQVIKSAIANKRQLKIQSNGTTFDMIVDPYILGDDFLQRPFVWAYVPFNEVWYKFHFDIIEKIALSNSQYQPQDNVHYYFSDQETLDSFIDPIQFWQNFGKHV